MLIVIKIKNRVGLYIKSIGLFFVPIYNNQCLNTLFSRVSLPEGVD